MAIKLPKARILKAGTRRGAPHYALECIGCPAWYGQTAVLRISGVDSKDTARELYAAHVASGHAQ